MVICRYRNNYIKKNISGAVPSKLYEAMACGIPIIILAHGEPSKIVKSAKCGYAIAPGDINELKRKTVKLSNNSSLRDVMGINSRKYVKKNFSRELINKKFLNEIETKWE